MLRTHPCYESMQFLSTPSARRATSDERILQQAEPISIHALREEGDAVPAVYGPDAGKISIHALREEGDRLVYDPELKTTQFLSTPSARRATVGSPLLSGHLPAVRPSHP